MTTQTDTTRKQALAKYLETDIGCIDESKYDESTFEALGGDYMVLTDEEADQRAADYIKDSLWAFNASFLAGYCDLPEEVFSGLQDKCEGANDTFYTLVSRAEGGIDGLIEEAISADGRGPFMSSYDGEEIEEGDFFIYRVN